MREFTNEGELIQIDSLEIAGCNLYPQFSDNAIQTNDGGFLLAYQSCSSQLIKLDSNFNLEWSNHYDEQFFSFSVIENSNGYLMVAQDTLGQGDIWLGMIDEEGNLLSESTFGDANLNDRIHWIDKTSDGGYILSGGRYYDWKPLIIKIDSLGNVEWEKTFGNNYKHTWSKAKAISDSTFIVASGMAIDDEPINPYRYVKLDLMNADGDIIENLYNTESGADLMVFDLEIVGSDIYCLYQQWSEPTANFYTTFETRAFKYDFNEGLVWERVYHPESNNQDRFTLWDLEILKESENEISILMAGGLRDNSITVYPLSCTWILGADCEGYPVYPELNISAELIDEGSPGDVLFENIGTQVNELNWWFSNGEVSSEISPQINFDNNGAYEIELTAPYCGETISAIDTFYVEGIGLEELLSTRKTLIKTIDVLGREVTRNYKGQVIDVFDDGTVRKRFKYE